ncbi:MAG: ATP-binding protein [Betaproteobacteria bacterium]|nr:ATP-binding protein [Betaproteobacteria bacterium]
MKTSADSPQEIPAFGSYAPEPVREFQASSDHSPTPPPLIYASPAPAQQAPGYFLASLWRSLQLFNGYRLALALTLALMPFYYNPPEYLLSAHYRDIAVGAGAIFISLALAGFLLSFVWKRHFFVQLSAQALIDAAGIGTIAFFYGGVQSGLHLALLLSIAGASLLTQGRLALFYAAVASLAVLSAESLLFLLHKTDSNPNFFFAGLLCVVFFAIAISVNHFGQRLVKNEALAHQRDIERNNQMQINTQVMEYMQDGVIVVDHAGHIVSLNLKAREILHAADSQQLDDLFPALAKAYQEWQRAKSGAPVILKQSGQAGLAKSNAREISVRFVPTKTSDMTALIFIEDMEHLRNEALQLKLASLGRLTANIAHEIRNPLAAISHAAELLREEVKTTVQTRLTRIIGDNTLRLDQIIKEILTLGRRRGDEPESESIWLAPYLDEFISEFSVQAGLEEKVLRASSPEEATIHFNPAQLQQVLWNIVNNALQYSTRRRGAVRIEARLHDNGVELHIIDDGPGIRQDLRDQIFEPFFTTSTRGTGLGLHIARELCEANRAKLIAGLEGGGHFIISQLVEEQWKNTQTEQPDSARAF